MIMMILMMIIIMMAMMEMMKMITMILTMMIPIDVTLVGIVTDVSAVQYWKADAP